MGWTLSLEKVSRGNTQRIHKAYWDIYSQKESKVRDCATIFQTRFHPGIIKSILGFISQSIGIQHAIFSKYCDTIWPNMVCSLEPRPFPLYSYSALILQCIIAWVYGQVVDNINRQILSSLHTEGRATCVDKDVFIAPQAVQSCHSLLVNIQHSCEYMDSDTIPISCHAIIQAPLRSSGKQFRCN